MNGFNLLSLSSLIDENETRDNDKECGESSAILSVGGGYYAILLPRVPLLSSPGAIKTKNTGKKLRLFLSANSSDSAA